MEKTWSCLRLSDDDDNRHLGLPQFPALRSVDSSRLPPYFPQQFRPNSAVVLPVRGEPAII